MYRVISETGNAYQQTSHRCNLWVKHGLFKLFVLMLAIRKSDEKWETPANPSGIKMFVFIKLLFLDYICYSKYLWWPQWKCIPVLLNILTINSNLCLHVQSVLLFLFFCFLQFVFRNYIYWEEILLAHITGGPLALS